MKRKLSVALIIALSVTMFGGVGTDQIYAKSKKVKFSTKKVTVYKGKTKSIKLKNVKKKVKWKIKNKKVAKIVKKSGKYKNSVKIKGLKKGSTKIIATYGKKKFTAKIVVKNKKKSAETETNATNNVKIVAEVTSVKTTPNSILGIKYSVQGDTDKEYTYTMAPGTLEIYQNGKWTPLKKRPVSVPEIAGIISKNSSGHLDLPLKDYYENVIEGRYRYTHTFSGIAVTVEFVLDDGVNVVFNNDQITVGSLITIEYSLADKSDFIYNCKSEKLEIYENGTWKEMTKIQKDINVAEGLLPTTNGIAKISFSLKNWYEDARPGHYRYTHYISGEYVSVEFDVVE